MLRTSVTDTPQRSTWVSISFAAIGYFVCARLSLFLALPPSEAAAVWPPAGIAAGSVLLLGRRAAIGVFLGALASYLTSWLDSETLESLLRSGWLSVALALGPTLQCLVVAALIRRSGEINLDHITESGIVHFLFLWAPIGCLVASSYCNAVLYFTGNIAVGEMLLSWLTWWVGDCIGVMTMTPLLLVLFQRSGSRVQSRRLSVGLPMILLLALVFLLMSFSQQRSHHELRRSFEIRVERLQHEFEERVDEMLDAIHVLKNYMESSEYVSASEFDRFSRGILSRHPDIHALEWIPRISHAARAAYEARTDTPSAILETDPTGARIPAAVREEYYPVHYVTPLTGNERALGWDIASNPKALQTQNVARRNGRPVATAPIRLVQENEDTSGAVLYLAVFQGGEFAGFVALVLRLEFFLDSLLSSSSNSGELLQVTIADEADSAERFYIYNEAADTDTQPSFTVSRVFEFSGRQWNVDYLSTAELLKTVSNWNSLVILVGGMLFTALFGSWLLTITGQTLRVVREVDRRTVELRREVAEREQVERELRKLSLAVQHSPSMVLITDPEGVVEYANPKFTEVTGYPASHLRGTHANHLFESEYGEGFFEGLIANVRRSGEWKGELMSSRKSGENYWVEMSLAPIKDGDGNIAHVVTVMQDITSTKEIQEQINYQASHDSLTGLINRFEFERELHRLIELQEATGVVHAYCFCDLDQFKLINDTSGHIAGDALLRQVAELMQSKLRRVDVLARLGGDEFGILMENCGLEEARCVAEKIIAEMEDFRFFWEGVLHNVGISIGVVAIDRNSNEITEILKHADTACFTAKDAGRNRVHVYRTDDELLSKRQGEISWISEINSALQEDRFELHGQVIVPILDGSLKPCIEVLIRLRRDGDLIMPGAFLPAAERYGLSPKIDRWVVGQSFYWLEKNSEAGNWIESLAINLSGHSLGDSRLLDYIYQQLHEGRVDPRAIKFEITETSAISNLAESRKFISAVKKLGCGFSLDDFGSGLSSFAYLKNLGVDFLKIDGMFVKDIADDPIDRAMVKSINEIAKVMGKKTIAEFVENDAVLGHLRELQVDFAQGYGIGKPRPLDELLEDIRQQSSMPQVQAR